MLYFLVYPLTYCILRIIAALCARVIVKGRENVAATGGVLYCPNHQSDSDPGLILITAPRRAWYVGKEELFSTPFAGWLFRHLHGIPIKRDSADRAALRRAEGLLKAGNPLVIFPEGRLSPDGKLLRMQSGAAMLALRAGIPIIPVGLTNTNLLMPYGELRPRRAGLPITVSYGAPIYPTEFDSLPKKERVDAFTQRVALAIGDLIGETPYAGDSVATIPTGGPRK